MDFYFGSKKLKIGNSIDERFTNWNSNNHLWHSYILNNQLVVAGIKIKGNILDKLKLLSNISIRGRFAIAIICMKRKFREVNLHQTYEAHFISEKMATLLTSDKLGIWEIEMHVYILSNEFGTAQEIISYLKSKDINLEVLDEQLYQSLIDFYINMDDETKEIIGLCETVVGSNLYCGYCEKLSIEPLVELLDRTDMWGNFDFYKIAKIYPFSSDDKWGKKFKFSDFKRS